MADRSPLRPLLLAYVGAFFAIVVLSLLAGGIVRGLYPDLPEPAMLEGLPWLLALVIASSLGLLLTVLIASRGVSPAGLRLVPRNETGPTLLVMVVGVLALAQALDSLTMIAGLGQQGSMAAIRRVLSRAAGPDVFLAVIVIGPLAGTAEEVFFRGYMQTRLREGFRPAVAVAIASTCFAVLHLDWLHGLLALALGLYLGWITELTGSALPAVACHVINNALFTMLTVRWGAVEGLALNAGLAAVCGLAFAGCVLWLRRARPAL